MRRSPYAREEIVVRHEMARRDHELLEESVLEPRQDDMPIADGELTRLEIENEPTADVQATLRRTPNAPHRELEPRNELATRMRGRDGVVGSGCERIDDGTFAWRRGQHDERCRCGGAELRGEADVGRRAVLEVGDRRMDDDLRNAHLERMESLVLGRRGLDVIAVRFEEDAQSAPLPVLGGGEDDPRTDGHDGIEDTGLVAVGSCGRSGTCSEMSGDRPFDHNFVNSRPDRPAGSLRVALPCRAMPFPAPAAAVPATSLADVDAAIDRLAAKKDPWLAVSTDARAALLDRCIACIVAVSERWAEIGARIKGLAPDDVLAGEEWVAGIMPTVRNARLLAEALRAGGAKKPPALRTRPDGQIVARVHPATLMERLMFTGVTADVWIEKGKPATQGAIYRDKKTEGRVCLVLGGGNVSSIPPMDVFYKLFVEDEVVLLKMNPVNEALGSVLEDALRPLIDEGVLAVVTGGAEVGGHAAQHPKIGALHVTGSDRTYDAIVWGSDPEERARRKQTGAKVNERSFTAELGCVTPVLIVPGPWSASDIRFQARHVASMVTQNASFNCNAAKVIVTARGWLQREAFLDALHDELRKTRARKAYYPGAGERHRAFLKEYPEAMVLGAVPSDEADEVVPWTAIPDVPCDAGGYALTNEAFCGVVAEVTLDLADSDGGMLRERGHGGPSAKQFLQKAVAFANERCWGTLSCCLLVHPVIEEDHLDDVANAVAALRYGGIGINVWPGVIYGLVTPSWGAYPGHRAEDIQSGTGVVHNAYMFDHPEKSVVRAPFRIRPTPAWFSDHKNLRELGQRLVAFEAKPSWGAFLGVVGAAVRG